jgi:hypothetical protein
MRRSPERGEAREDARLEVDGGLDSIATAGRQRQTVSLVVSLGLFLGACK